GNYLLRTLIMNGEIIMKYLTAFAFLLSTLVVVQEVGAQTHPRGPSYNPGRGGGSSTPSTPSRPSTSGGGGGGSTTPRGPSYNPGRGGSSTPSTPSRPSTSGGGG